MQSGIRNRIHVAVVTFAALLPLLAALMITAVTPSGTLSIHAGRSQPAWDSGFRPTHVRMAFSRTLGAAKNSTWRDPPE